MRNRFLYQNLPMFAPAGPGGIVIRREGHIDIDPNDLPDVGNRNRRQGGNEGGGENNDTNRGNDDLSLDPEAILSQFWGDGDGESGEQNDDTDPESGEDDNEDDPPRRRRNRGDDQNDDDPPLSRPARELAATIRTTIEGIGLPDDLLPENFNPSDPVQLRDALTRTARNTAAHTSSLMVRVMQQILTAEREAMHTEIDRRVNGQANQQRTRQMLESAIPEMEQPALAPLIQTMFDRAMKTHKGKPAAAIAATKRSMAALGMILGGSQSPGGDRRGSRSTRSGNEALDQFFPAGNEAHRRMTRSSG